MALITKVIKEETRPVSVKLENSLADRLTAYAEYLNRSRDEIVSLALDHAMRGDKDFVATLSAGTRTTDARPRKRAAKVNGAQ
jgi:predicted transcriptional regulator